MSPFENLKDNWNRFKIATNTKSSAKYGAKYDSCWPVICGKGWVQIC